MSAGGNPKKGVSPTLDLKITEGLLAKAKSCDSGACVIADAIKEQYPQFSAVSVDMATIRVSDRKKGYRYTYLTPEPAGLILLAFDQGWSNPFTEVRIKRAVKITPIKAVGARRQDARMARIAALEAKEARGELLDSTERRSLAASRAHAKNRGVEQPERPTSEGPREVHIPAGSTTPVVVGGPDLKKGPAHPNLLRQKRRFGMKQAHPGQAWQEAVDEAAEARAREIVAARQQQQVMA